MDVSIDQYFVFGINTTKTEFDGSQEVRNVGNTTEATGDSTNLGPLYY